MQSPTNRRAVGLDFSALGGKKQRHGSVPIGADVTGFEAPGMKTPNPEMTEFRSSRAQIKS